MSRILLFDSDRDHAHRVASALRTICSQITVCPKLQETIVLLQKEAFDAIVVVAVPHSSWSSAVETIRQATFQLPDSPQIICLLRGPYRGTAERIYAARKGFKVVYER